MVSVKLATACAQHTAGTHQTTGAISHQPVARSAHGARVHTSTGVAVQTARRAWNGVIAERARATLQVKSTWNSAEGHHSHTRVSLQVEECTTDPEEALVLHAYCLCGHSYCLLLAQVVNWRQI